MANNGFGSLCTGCVHLLVHFGGERSIPWLNVVPDQCSYLDLVDDISGLANNDGINNEGLSLLFLFVIPLVQNPHQN